MGRRARAGQGRAGPGRTRLARPIRLVLGRQANELVRVEMLQGARVSCVACSSSGGRRPRAALCTSSSSCSPDGCAMRLGDASSGTDSISCQRATVTAAAVTTSARAAQGWRMRGRHAPPVCPCPRSAPHRRPAAPGNLRAARAQCQRSQRALFRRACGVLCAAAAAPYQTWRARSERRHATPAPAEAEAPQRCGCASCG